MAVDKTTRAENFASAITRKYNQSVSTMPHTRYPDRGMESANIPPLHGILGELKRGWAVPVRSLPGITAPEPPLDVVLRGRSAVERKRRSDVGRPEGSKQQLQEHFQLYLAVPLQGVRFAGGKKLSTMWQPYVERMAFE